MTISLRLFLLASAAIVCFVIVRKIKSAQIRVIDSSFWLLFAFSFVVLAVFPQIAYFISDGLGFESPSNCVFLYAIAVLVIKDFSSTIKINAIQNKLIILVQEMALENASEQTSVEEK